MVPNLPKPDYEVLLFMLANSSIVTNLVVTCSKRIPADCCNMWFVLKDLTFRHPEAIDERKTRLRTESVQQESGRIVL